MRLDSLIGITLGGRYVLQEVLGHGAHATVFRATQSNPQSDVAVKIVDPDVIALDNLFAERFLHEAEQYAQLRDAHTPHVATILDFATDEATGLVYLVSTLLGPSLDSLIRTSGPLDPPVVARLALHIATALQAVHARNWVHCDVKCSNILINRDGTQFVLSDFGVSTIHDVDRTMPLDAQVLGSPLYSAPELRNNPGVSPDTRIDLYSLGVVLYRAATGSYPELTGDIQLTHLRGSLPEPVRRAIPRLLNADPDQRIQTSGDLLTLLGRPIRHTGRNLIAALVLAALLTVAGIWRASTDSKLTITSVPSGATFILEPATGTTDGADHRVVGRTPHVLRRLRSGPYRLHMELTGYVPVVADFTYPEQATSNLFPAQLQPAVAVEITSNQDAASFSIRPLDTRGHWRQQPPEIHATTPWRSATSLASGVYLVAFDATSGFRSANDTLVVGPGGARAKFHLDATVCTLQVESRPSAAVWIDGRKWPGRTPLEIANLAPGRHLITFVGPAGFAKLDTMMDLKASSSALVVALNQNSPSGRAVPVNDLPPHPERSAASEKNGDRKAVRFALHRRLLVEVDGGVLGERSGTCSLMLTRLEPHSVVVRDPVDPDCEQRHEIRVDDSAEVDLGTIDAICSLVTVAANADVSFVIDGVAIPNAEGRLLTFSAPLGVHRLGVRVEAPRAIHRVVYYPDMKELPMLGEDERYRFYRLDIRDEGETKLHVQVR